MQQGNKRISKIADIGELDQRITLMKKKYIGENPNTAMQMYKDVRLGDVWAKVSALHGQEYYRMLSWQSSYPSSFIIVTI